MRASQEHLSRAIITGKKYEVLRALNRLSLNTKIKELKDKVDAAKPGVSDITDTIADFADRGTAKIGQGVESTRALLVKTLDYSSGKIGQGVDYAHQKLPAYLKIPVFGAAVGASLWLASKPVQLLGWMVRKTTGSEFISNRAKNMCTIGKWALYAGIGAGVTKAGWDVYKQGTLGALALESMRGDIPNPELVKSINERLGNGILWMKDNKAHLPIMPLYPVDAVTIIQKDAAGTVIGRAIETKPNQVIQLEPGTKNLIVSYKLRGDPENKIHEVTVERKAPAA